MRWNMRLVAAHKNIWKASELQRLLAERGLEISAGKMSHLWSGQPASIKLSDLEVICAVLDCGVDELLLREPESLTQPAPQQEQQQKAVGEGRAGPVPRPAVGGRTKPPR